MRAVVHASTLFAPLVMLASLSSFAFGVSAPAIDDAKAAFVAVPLAALVAAFLGQRRPGWLVVAHAASLLALALAVFGAATLVAAAPSFSFGERPSLLIGLVACVWSCSSVSALVAEAMREAA
jgi:hypothetical protein